MRHLIALAFIAAPLALQGQSATVSPGMNRTQVVAALGEPVTARVASEYTYMFYRNDCGKACGMNDLVVLRSDSVIDAIFRSPSRHYTGTSSSPAPLTRTEARTGAAPARPVAMPKPATTTAAAAPATATPAAAAPAARPAPAQAVPVKKEVATTAAPPRTPTPEELAGLRRELLGSGLTSTQVRARLRERGFAENLLDADIRGAATAQAAAPTLKVKPSAPSDTRPSVPAGEPPVRKATTTPAPVPAPAPAPTPTPKPTP